MKKVLIFTNIITLGLLIWCWLFYCKKHHQALTTCQQSLDSCQMKSFQGGGDCGQTPSDEDFTIPSNQAIQLIGNYSTGHWQTINAANSDSTKDSRSIWFSLSRLKGFIRHIEQRSEEIMSDSSCCDTLGIRIYFGQYTPSLVSNFSLPSNYANKTTVLMVPTHQWSDGKHHDFNPDYYSAQNPFICDSSLKTQWTVPITALMINHGGIIPPPFPSRHAVEGNVLIYAKSGADFMVQAIDEIGNNNPHFHVTTPPGNVTWGDE